MCFARYDASVDEDDSSPCGNHSFAEVFANLEAESHIVYGASRSQERSVKTDMTIGETNSDGDPDPLKHQPLHLCGDVSSSPFCERAAQSAHTPYPDHYFDVPSNPLEFASQYCSSTPSGYPSSDVPFNHLLLEPQVGFTDSFDDLKSNLAELHKIAKLIKAQFGDEQASRVLKEAEGLIALYVAMSDCTSFPAMVSCIILYLRAHFEKSMCEILVGYVLQTFGATKDGETDYDYGFFGLSPQLGEVEIPIVQPASEGWIGFFKDLRDDWHSATNNGLFAHFSKIFGILVVAGCCKSADLTFGLGPFELLSPDITSITKDSRGIVPALCDIIIYFTEKVYSCWSQKSFRPFMTHTSDGTTLEVEYVNLCNYWALYRNGNLFEQKGVTEQDFHLRLTMMTSVITTIVETTKGIDRRIAADKLRNLISILSQFNLIKVNSGFRRAPFVVEYFGESNVGKSTISEQLGLYLFSSAGLDTSMNRKYVLPSGKKHWDGAKSDMLEVKLDDYANTKAAHTDVSPTVAFIQLCNNLPFSPPMADLAEKAQVWVQPELVTVTTNLEALLAEAYSNVPHSIQRRAHYVLELKVKKPFQKIVAGVNVGIDTAAVIAHYTTDGVFKPPPLHDIWIITVKVAVKPKNMESVSTYAIVKGIGGKLMHNVGITEVANFLAVKFNEHRNMQRCLELANNDKTPMTKCPWADCVQLEGYCKEHDGLVSEIESPKLEDYKLPLASLERCTAVGCCQMKGVCDKHTFVPHLGVVDLVTAGERARDYAVEQSTDTMSIISSKLQTVCDHYMPHVDCSTQLMEEARSYYSFHRLIPNLPICMYNSRILVWMFVFMNRSTIIEWYRMHTAINIGYAVFFWYLLHSFVPSGFDCICSNLYLVIFLLLMRQWYLVTVVRDQYYLTLRRTGTLTQLTTGWEARALKNVFLTAGTLGCLYTFATMARGTKRLCAQGTLAPKSQNDIDIRDKQDNVWSSVEKTPLPITAISKTVTPKVLEGLVIKNLVYGLIHHPDKKDGMMNCLFLRSNVLIVPNHYFSTYGSLLNCTFSKRNPETSGGRFNARLCYDSSYHIPDTDLRLCYVPNGGTFRNLTCHFPIGAMPKLPFTFLWRDHAGDLIKATGFTVPQRVGHNACEFEGGMYENLSIKTFAGMCGGPLVSTSVGSVILGVHLGGITDKPIGCYGSILQSELIAGCTFLRTIEGVALTADVGLYRGEIMGVQVGVAADLHPKSPLNYMPENSQIEYHGSCIGRSVFRSDCKVTPISHLLLDVCDSPNIYGPPVERPEWFGWQNCLSNIAKPALPFQHGLLTFAVFDYKSALLPIFGDPLWSCARPLTDHENLCGIPGIKFMDAIKLNTSIGMPLSGPKRNYVVELEPEDGKPNNRIFTPEIAEEIAYNEACYARGDRAYPIAKACKKDEILSKPKCRIFYGNAISLTYLIRKYYLPILRVLQMNPLESECAVGINAHGPEWDEFYRHIMQNGEERIFAGDYGKYDQKLPSQLIIAAMRILIDFARCCDYTMEQISIMEAMIADIVYAYINFNGDLISLTQGGHISGNSLTVVINGICGSLNLRCFFYTVYPAKQLHDRIPFRDAVAIATYGDDNAGTVGEDYSKFNIAECSRFLAMYGQTYTMPDKTSELLPYLPVEQFEFLKRSSVYHNSLDHYVGALSDQSIYKSLHCFLRGKGCVDTESVAVANNMDGALREWFNHGPEVYERQRVLMVEVARLAEISHLCRDLNKTYSDRVSEWQEKYMAIDYVLYEDTVDEDAIFGW